MMFLTELRPLRASHAKPQTARPAATFQPTIDLWETSEAYVLTLELPGIDPASIELTLVGEELTIKGEKVAPKLPEEITWHVRNTTWGAFERTVTFPAAVTNDGVQATTRHGVLTIQVAKAPEAIRHTIPINVAP